MANDGDVTLRHEVAERRLPIAMSGVADDPEGAVALVECLAQWNQLPPEARERVLLLLRFAELVEATAG